MSNQQSSRVLIALEMLVEAIENDNAIMGGCGEATEDAYNHARRVLDTEELEPAAPQWKLHPIVAAVLVLIALALAVWADYDPIPCSTDMECAALCKFNDADCRANILDTK